MFHCQRHRNKTTDAGPGWPAEKTGTSGLNLEQIGVGMMASVSLSIAPGEIVCLSGSSGSGKTRLLRAIADLDVHDGEAWLGDVAQTAIKAHCWRRQVMLVPADSPWWADRVGEHLYHADALIPELAALGFGPEVLDWQIERLSSGEKQRLALLRAYSCEPMALLLDEPTANLDPDLTLCTERWLMGWARGQALPVLWVSHDRSQISRVADRHYHLRDGRLEVR